MTITNLSSESSTTLGVTTRGAALSRAAASNSRRTGRGLTAGFGAVLAEAAPASEEVLLGSRVDRGNTDIRHTTATQRAASPVPDATAAAAAPPDPDGPRYMMPMQQSWTPPVIPKDESGPPLHPVYRVPMVSPESLNRYFHPLQAIGSIAPNSIGTGSEIQTTIYRVAPGGLQDFVTSDGFRHRFDVEVVFPAPGSIYWQDRESTSIHPEVAEFAVGQLRERLQEAGLDVEELEIEPFRMKGGTANRPWLLDQLILKQPGKEDLPISLNVAMRDPAYTVQTILERWAEPAIPS